MDTGTSITRFSPKATLYTLLGIFVGVRALSFVTYEHEWTNAIITVLLIAGFIYVSFKNLSLGWTLLMFELLLGGSGHFFELQSLILRTWFLGIFALLWLYKKVKERRFSLTLPRPLLVLFCLTALVIIWAIIRALILGHAPILILQDAMLYLFLLLFFPAAEFREPLHTFLPIFIKAFIIGSAIFSLVTFVLYASGIGSLPDLYYHWFRNIAAGKITDLGHHFFRIVLPEHLFIVPLILVLASYLMQNTKQRFLWFFLFCSLLVLALNFSRMYFLALAFGLLVLVYKQRFGSWLRTSALVCLSLLVMFVALNALASRGASSGLELLGVRIQGVTRTQTDVSGAIRLAMLPDIKATIQENPLIGSGLGTMVSYTDPVTKERVSRTQFDWGYFEMLAELGGIGTVIFIALLLTILYYLVRLTEGPLARGLLAGGASLFVINLTTPALFQGFGILYFVFLLTIICYTKDNRKPHLPLILSPYGSKIHWNR